MICWLWHHTWVCASVNYNPLVKSVYAPVRLTAKLPKLRVFHKSGNCDFLAHAKLMAYGVFVNDLIKNCEKVPYFVASEATWFAAGWRQSRNESVKLPLWPKQPKGKFFVSENSKNISVRTFKDNLDFLLLFLNFLTRSWKIITARLQKSFQ